MVVVIVMINEFVLKYCRVLMLSGHEDWIRSVSMIQDGVCCVCVCVYV